MWGIPVRTTLSRGPPINATKSSFFIFASNKGGKKDCEANAHRSETVHGHADDSRFRAIAQSPGRN
eukprot:8589228-Pyramimonas_sp.AAC.1